MTGLISAAIVTLIASIVTFFLGRKSKEVEERERQGAIAGAATVVIATEDRAAEEQEEAGRAEVGAKLDATLRTEVTPEDIDAALAADEARRARRGS